MVSHLTLLLTYCGSLFKDFSSTFQYFQRAHPFSSTFKGFENSFVKVSIFKEFSIMIWTLSIDTKYNLLTLQFNSIQFKLTLTPKVTSSKRLSQCKEHMFIQKRFQFIHEHVCYVLNCMGQTVPSFRPIMRKIMFAKLQLSCQSFIMELT